MNKHKLSASSIHEDKLNGLIGLIEHHNGVWLKSDPSWFNNLPEQFTLGPRYHAPRLSEYEKINYELQMQINYEYQRTRVNDNCYAPDFNRLKGAQSFAADFKNQKIVCVYRALLRLHGCGFDQEG